MGYLHAQEKPGKNLEILCKQREVKAKAES